MTTHLRLVVRRVFRIGVIQLYRNVQTGRYTVTLDNRTYHQLFEIPQERETAWFRLLNWRPL